MKNKIISLITISLISTSITNAEISSSQIAMDITGNSIVRNIKNYFIGNSNTTVTPTTYTFPTSPSYSSISNNSISSTSPSSSTDSLNINKICETKNFTSLKKSKINKAVKDQISDKNKLINNLTEISSNTEDLILKEKLDNKISELEEKVKEINEKQNQLLALIDNSTTTNSTSTINCLSKNKSSLNSAIRNAAALEDEINNLNKEIKQIIKKDIVDIIKEIDSKLSKAKIPEDNSENINTV